MNKGAIIIGYQGIGKSSTIKENGKDNLHFLDMESSCWKDSNGKRNDNWYVSYCNIALDLAKQGNYVFTASHKEVREYFKENHNDIPILVVMPSIALKYTWIKRLSDRYDNTHLDKDKFALLNAQDRYTENIKELYDYAKINDFKSVIISNTGYNLRNELKEYLK